MARREACRALSRALAGATRRSGSSPTVAGPQRQLLQQFAVPLNRGIATLSTATSAKGQGLFSAASAAAAVAVVTSFAASTVACAAEPERTFIAIKPDGVQRGLIADIVARFERKGYRLVAIKLVHPTKAFAEKHYDDLKGRPFFNGLTDFLSSGPVLAMVWEGPGVIEYGRKMIGATNPQASAPGTIRGDLAIIVGRNIIHGSDGPETAQNEISLWFKPTELLNYKLDSHKWVYDK